MRAAVSPIRTITITNLYNALISIPLRLHFQAEFSSQTAPQPLSPTPSCIPLSTRIQSLRREESVGQAFQRWMGEGFPINRGDIFNTINKLRKRKLHDRALEVMEWVVRERPYRLRELEYSFLLEFTVKIHGITEGESLFLRVPPQFQNELLYNNLVLACLDKDVIKLSLEYMRKMRELNLQISHLAFNRLIILHSTRRRRSQIPSLLIQMKADKVPSHVSTFNILMKLHSNDHNIEELMNVYSNMTKQNIPPNEISYCILATSHVNARLFSSAQSFINPLRAFSSSSSLETLMILYAQMGEESELDGAWEDIKRRRLLTPKSYTVAVEAYGRVNVPKAESIWEEMKAKRGLKSIDDFNALLAGYCRYGMVKKAVSVLREMGRRGYAGNAITYRNLALGCVRGGHVAQGERFLRKGKGFVVSKRVKRSAKWLECTLGIAVGLAERGDVEGAERVFADVEEARYTRYTFVYNELIGGYVRGRVYVDGLLRRMILAGGRPDSETYSLVKVIQQFKKD